MKICKECKGAAIACKESALGLPVESTAKKTSKVKTSTSSFIALSSSIALFWVLWAAKAIAFLEGMNDLEKLSIASQFVLTFIILESFILIIIRSRNAKGRKTALIIISIFLIITHLLFVYAFPSSAYAIRETVCLAAKGHSGKAHWLAVENKAFNTYIKMDCSKEMFDNLIINNSILYEIEYRMTVFNKKTAKLHRLNPIER
jgi:hypothetical protein